MASSSSSSKPLRIFFIPFFATSHLISMTKIACLFASRGTHSTILTTPANDALVHRIIDQQHSSSGGVVQTLLYPFPSAEVGLPPGVENLSSVPRAELYKMDIATLHTRPSHESLLRLHSPDAIVSDIHFPWTVAVARDLGIPNINYHSIGLFPVCVMSSLFDNRPHLAVSDDSQPFLVPGLPDPVCMNRAELPEFFRSETTALAARMEIIRAADAGTYGVIVNSFSDIESAYADYYHKFSGAKRSWFVGPVDLPAGYNDNENDSDCRQMAMKWLDTKSPGSVIYVCFGSWCYFSADQIKELASGLEGSGHPFLWVVREEDLEHLPIDFERKVEGKGLVLRGWAPQVAILEHSAVGGFVTHCGWQSVVEGITAGVPMVTWPLSMDQFINEKLVVEVLRIGVKNWDGLRSTAEEERVVVKAEDVGRAVGRIMRGAEAEEMRKRAREYAEKAREAVKEGGSSYNGLTSLIEQIKAWPYKVKDLSE